MGDYAEIPLRARDGSERARVKVDVSDAEWVTRHRWKLTAKGYAQREQYDCGVYRSVRMHRVIMGLDKGDPRQVDHRNGDRLDNRRENLRIVPAAAQAQNVRRGPGLRGVARLKSGRYAARGRTDGVLYHLGTYDTAEDAALVARAWRLVSLPYALD